MRKRHKTAPVEAEFERIGSWTVALTAAVTPLVYWPVARDPNLAKPIALVLGLIVLVVVLGVKAMGGERVRIRWTALDTCVLLCLAITCASWTYSHFKYATTAAIRPILIYTMLYFGARLALASEAARRRAILGLLAGSIVVSALAIAERYGHVPWSAGAVAVSTWFNRTFLAAYLLLTLPVAAWAVFAVAVKLRLAGVAALAAGLPALAFTEARIAWVALGPMMLVAAAVAWPMMTARRKALILRGAVAATVLFAALQIGAGRACPRWTPARIVAVSLSKGMVGDRVRLALMEAAWRVGRDRPAFGSGAGTYGIYAPEKVPHEFYEGVLDAEGLGARVVIVNAHNELLEVFAELGALGLLAFLAIAVSAAWIARRALRSNETPAGERWLPAALLAGTVGFLCANLVGISARVPGEAGFWYLLLSLIASVSGRRTEQPGEPVMPGRRLTLAVPAAVLALLAATGWGYITDLRSSIYLVRGESLMTSAADISGAEAALEEFRRACEIAPKSPAAQYDLANALAVVGRHDEALRVYSLVEQLSPNYGRVHFNQGTSLYNLRWYREAEHEMALAYRLDGLPDSRYRLACLRGMLTQHRSLAPRGRRGGPDVTGTRP